MTDAEKAAWNSARPAVIVAMVPKPAADAMTPAEKASAVAVYLSPITRAEAQAFVRAHHRHAVAPVGDLFRVALRRRADDAIVGVGIASRPVARALDDGLTVEITRIAAIIKDSACTRLYGALCRAAFALGYTRIVTYTRADEAGGTCRGAGFLPVGTCPGRTWTRGGALTLFPLQKHGQGVDRVRWERHDRR
jgi:hypothetical protein